MTTLADKKAPVVIKEVPKKDVSSRPKARSTVGSNKPMPPPATTKAVDRPMRLRSESKKEVPHFMAPTASSARRIDVCPLIYLT